MINQPRVTLRPGAGISVGWRTMCESARPKSDATTKPSGRLTKSAEPGGQSGETAAVAAASSSPAAPSDAPICSVRDAAQRIAQSHEQVAECLRLVEAAQTSEEKMLLTGMARAWLSLAEQIEQLVARRGVEDG